jgi:hypothetical protein
LTAAVSSSSGAPPNGENVTFMSGTTSLGTAQFTSGVASLTTTALPTGTDSITAVYSGDSDYSGSTSTAVSQKVNKASSSTTLSTSLSPSAFGQSVTFTANISGQFSGVATGTVTFSNGSTSLGSGTVSSNMASLTTAALPAGTDSITASYSGDSNFTGSTSNAVSQTVNKATPTITWATPAAITYGTALSATQLDATASVPGSFVYSPAAGTTPAVGSDTLSVTFTPTDATDYNSATASVTLTVNPASNPAPVISSISPAFTNAGGAAFTLTVNGSGFTTGSMVYWGTSALTTTAGSATQITAQVPAADIASAGIGSITVQTPAPGGGTSNAFQFEVDSAASGTTTFTTLTATVVPGAAANYPVTLPSGSSNATVSCLNLPSGAACTYSSATDSVTITTSSTTPAGTYQITVVFTVTEPGSGTAFILLPILLLPLAFLRRKLAARGVWVTAFLGLVLLAGAAATFAGCGGGPTHQATSSGAVTLVVQ